jgi:hypothetical protein
VRGVVKVGGGGVDIYRRTERYGREHQNSIASSRSNTIRRLLLLPVRVIFLMSLLWPPMSTLITASIGYTILIITV